MATLMETKETSFFPPYANPLPWWIGIRLYGQILPFAKLENDTSLCIPKIFKFIFEVHKVLKQRWNNYVVIEYLNSLKKGLHITETRLYWTDISETQCLTKYFPHSNDRDNTVVHKSWPEIWQYFLLKILTVKLPFATARTTPTQGSLGKYCLGPGKLNLSPFASWAENCPPGLCLEYHHPSQLLSFLWSLCWWSKTTSLVLISFLSSSLNVGWNKRCLRTKSLLPLPYFT